MKVALIGAEIEENLALRYIHASLAAAGHQPALFGFGSRGEIETVARAVVAFDPAVVGLSMLFTSRSREFVELAERLRALGWAGHLCAGGHFAAFHAAELLGLHPAFDSVAHGEGEELMVELCASLDDPSLVPGLSVRGPDGHPLRTAPRPNRPDLDGRPWPTRPDRFHRYLGLPIANLLSGRGCYGRCHFCSIQAMHRQSGGRGFRQRDPACVAAELAMLYHRRGVRIFNFQDDNFFLPTAAASMARLVALQAAMQDEGVGRVALQIKARPDSIEPELVDQLVSMGLFRVFLGIETDAVTGLHRLGRGVQREQNHRALRILGERGVHTCFNLLMFDPDSDLPSLRENLAFMATQRDFPLNFCRVEVYAGTAMQQRLREQGRLEGDWLGHTYTIADPAAQRAYALFWRVFAPRNFGEGGLHHESMRLDYHLHLLRHFHPERVDGALWRRCKALLADLNLDSARRMGELLDRAEALGSDGEIEAVAAELRQGRARADRLLGREAGQLLGLVKRRAMGGSAPRPTLRVAAPAVAAVLLASAWVGADAALAQDDEGVHDDNDESSPVLIPELEDEEQAPEEQEIVILPDTVHLPDTHMCEAAPPPWDLYNMPPPPPPPPLGPTLLAIDGVLALRQQYLERCSASVALFVDRRGVVTRILVHSSPHMPELQGQLEAVLVGVVLDQVFRGDKHQASLWTQLVRQVREVEE